MQGRDDPQADLWDVGSVVGRLLPPVLVGS
jgi:hypothetical protein